MLGHMLLDGFTHTGRTVPGSPPVPAAPRFLVATLILSSPTLLSVA